MKQVKLFKKKKKIKREKQVLIGTHIFYYFEYRAFYQLKNPFGLVSEI